MSNYYSDPTASAATGAVDQELRQMKKRAREIGRQYRLGLLSPKELAQAARPFTGIYRRFLLEALAPRKKANQGTPQGCPLSFASIPEWCLRISGFQHRF